VNGIEVADGDINVNVKDGMVLSYGDSFYNGPTPTTLINQDDDVEHTHTAYCFQLGSEVLDRRDLLADFVASLSGEQTILGSPVELQEAITGPLEHLYESNCARTHIPYQFAMGDDPFTGDIGDSKKALLQFMIAATPNDQVLQDILGRYDEHLANMTSSFEVSLVGDHQSMTEHIDNVPDTVNPVKTKLAYVQVPKGDKTVLNLVWKFEVEMQDNWYEASVSASSPHRIIFVVDWASDSPIPPETSPGQGATYNVFRWGVNDPSEDNRTIEKENYDALASPVGWHAIPYANDPQSARLRLKKSEFWRNTTTTYGNNVFAHEDWEGRNNWVDNYRPDAGKDMAFDYKYKPKVTDDAPDSLAEAKKYINATVTQLFYTSNMVHDLFYRYGFDEVSGNFQQYNFGRGGAENDAVIANAQDGSGYNNANFMTPPDGQNGRCRMYLWNTANPYRDGDLEAGIVIHELAHGLSTRLTGGPANSACLGWGESGGMGEGWGDFLATTIRSTRNYSDYAMGAWAANSESGIRHFIYSLNETINPSTYKTLDKPGYWGVHAIGEVWAEILWVVSQRLIAKHGYVDSLFPPAPLEDGTIPVGDFYRPIEYTAFGATKPLVPKHGNSLTVQLVLNAMKLQRCRPSFFDARDAIIQADQVLTGGENFCDLWKGFSERGLGPDASLEGSTPWGGGIRTNDYGVPLVCRGETIAEKPTNPYIYAEELIDLIDDFGNPL
jgi:extracellular elastinolytic metalloproteinase